MPFLLDKATGETRGVSQAVYDQWIQQTDRFAPALDDAKPTPAVVEEAPSTASDLIGTGKAPTSGFTDASPAPSPTPEPQPEPIPVPEPTPES